MLKGLLLHAPTNSNQYGLVKTSYISDTLRKAQRDQN